MRRWLPLLAVVTALATVGPAPRAETAPEMGREAPDFTLPDLAGKATRLGDWRGKKAVLVNFWATWCEPCREELPSLERLSRERRDVIEVVGVNLDVLGPNRVRAYVRELGLTFVVLLDPKQKIGALYRIRGVPASFIVGKDGVVRYRELGYRDWTDREARFIVDEALRPR
jgi:peroxiredoxin